MVVYLKGALLTSYINFKIIIFTSNAFYRLTFTDVEEMPYRLPEDKKMEIKISSAPPYTLRRCQDKFRKYRDEGKRLKEAQERMFKAILDKVNEKGSGDK